MSRKRHLILLIACVISFMCFFVTWLNPLNRWKSSTSQNSSIGINDTSGVAVKDKIDQKEYIKKDSLGSAIFKVDKDHSVTKEFSADGNSMTLELIDEAGIIWTLMIPEDALLYPQTITMKAMSDINSSTFPGKVTGGICLWPDGLQLLKPATLTVSGQNITGKSFILEGNNDGSETDYAYLNEPADSSICSHLFHLGSVFVSEIELKDFHEKALEDYNEAIKAAKAIIKKSLEISPPPSFDLRCKDNEAIVNEAVDQYIRLLKNPEEDVIMRLIKVKKNLFLLGEEESGLNCDKYLQGLVQRQLKKVNTLIRDYKYQHEKYLYAETALFSVVKEGAMLGLIDNEIQKAYLSTVGEWCKKAREYYLSELINKHDYKAYSAILILTKRAVMMSVLDSTKANMELSDAMSFEIQFESEIEDKIDSYRLHGKIPVEFDEDSCTITGEGTGHYDEYVSNSFSETAEYTGPSTFKVKAIIDVFKPCQGSMDILIDRFGSLQESFLVTDKYGYTHTVAYDNEANWEEPTVHTDMAAAFYEHNDIATGYYRFHLELNDMTENTVDQTVVNKPIVDQTVMNDTTEEMNYAKIHFKLVHIPK